MLESLTASSAGQYNLSLAKLDKLPIPVPDIASQRAALIRLAEVQSGMARVELQLSTLSEKSARLRRALLNAAFSGQLTGHSSDPDRVEEMAE